ncbi:unnamed protein product [Allacma fusca]|uniref:Uncharacterized protein n=1 Tax=Allacma fusca TaxID=39272 RepID=A0A8J2PQX4_9HEXA|nr:unnamed protein product [Allacma fusca]
MCLLLDYMTSGHWLLYDSSNSWVNSDIVMAAENVLVSDVEFVFELEDKTLPKYLLRRSKELADEGKSYWITDVISGESHSYEDYNDETQRIASFFYKHGVRLGDTVIYMTSDLVKIHIIFAGIWRANGIVRASYPEDDEDTLISRVEESRVGWIICDHSAVEMCKSVAQKVYWDVEVIVYGDADGCTSIEELFQDDGTECPELEIAEDSPALILCTSGTTGRSKGAVHTHNGLLQTLASTDLYLPLTSDAPNLFISKGTHITGCVFPLCAFVSGKHCLVMPVINKHNLFESVTTYKPGFIWGFPTFLLLMVNDPEASNYDFSSITIVASGGAQITPQIQKTMQELPNLEAFVNIYGLTEVVPLCGENDPSTKPMKKFDDIPPFSVGKVSPGASITIRDPDTGVILGQNERGEICVKTERAFASYLNNSEATSDAFIDGYFKTGDLGYFDENQFIFLVDRIKEIFKYFNNHISPTELEDVISQHDAINEVCVFGIDDPEGGGSIPRAVATVKSGDVTSEEILEFANGKLPDYKKLRGGLFIVDELPRGKTGKITRNLHLESLPNFLAITIQMDSSNQVSLNCVSCPR